MSILDSIIELVHILIYALLAYFFVSKLYEFYVEAKKEAKLRKEQEEISYSRSQEALKKIKAKREQLLEKYGDKTIISKLDAKEHYEKIKELHEAAEHTVKHAEALNELIMRLRMDDKLPRDKPDKLFDALITKEGFKIRKDVDVIQIAIDYANKLLDNCQDHESQEILEQYKQQLHSLKEICRDIFQYCRAFIGEDDNDEAEDYIKFEHYIIDEPARFIIERVAIMNKFLYPETEYDFVIRSDYLCVELIPTTLITQIGMDMVISYLQKP